MKIHDSLREKIVCLGCGKTFCKPSNLVSHCKIAHPTKNSIITESLNAEREKSKKDDFAHKCVICGKGYKQSKSLKQHLNEVHLQLRVRPQCEHCDKSFRNMAGLRKHEKLKHMPRGTLSTPIDHMDVDLQPIVSNNSKPANQTSHHKCAICGKCYKRPKSLEQHLNKVHIQLRGRPQCEHCNKSFGNMAEIRKHMKLKHMPRETSSTPIDYMNVDLTPIVSIEGSLQGVEIENEMADHVEQTNVEHSLPVEETIAMHSNHSEKSSEIFCQQSSHEHVESPSRNDVNSCEFQEIQTNVYFDSVKPIKLSEDVECYCKRDDGCGEGCFNRIIFSECNTKLCPSGNKCKNTKIQNINVAHVQRFMTQKKGMGLKAKKTIKANDFIMEYIGQVVNKNEYMKRLDTIYKDDKHHYGLHLVKNQIIDGHRMGNDSRFINHSCVPNAKIQKWIIDGFQRAAIFAINDIKENEEITMDYNFKPFTTAQKCECGTRKCRGIISQDVAAKSKLLNALKLIEKPQQQSKKQVNLVGSIITQSKKIEWSKIEKIIETKSLQVRNDRKKSSKLQQLNTEIKASLSENSQIQSETKNKSRKTLKKQSNTSNKPTGAYNEGTRKSERIKLASNAIIRDEQKRQINETRAKLSSKAEITNNVNNDGNEYKSDSDEEENEIMTIDENDSKRFIKVVHKESTDIATVSTPTLIEPITEKALIFPGNLKTKLSLSEEMVLFSQDMISEVLMRNQNDQKLPLQYYSNHGHLRHEGYKDFYEELRNFSESTKHQASTTHIVSVKDRLGYRDLRTHLNNKTPLFGGPVDNDPQLRKRRAIRFENNDEIIRVDIKKPKTDLNFEAIEKLPREKLISLLTNIKTHWTEHSDYNYACDQLRCIQENIAVSTHFIFHRIKLNGLELKADSKLSRNKIKH